MDSDGIKQMVKCDLHLDTDDYDLMIFDVVREVCDYCNRLADDIPDGLAVFVRRKVQGMIAFELERGSGYQAEVASISEGDTSVSFAQTAENSRCYVCELNDVDRSRINRYRKLRW